MLIRNLILMLLVALASGCSSTDLKLINDHKKDQIENAESHKLFIPEYPDQVQSGDLLFIQREDDLAGVEYRVSDSGVFYYPYVGEVQAKGLTPAEIAEFMTLALKDTFKRPQVTVNISSRANNQIFIGGEVNNNGVYEANSSMTIMQSIFMAGGFKEFAAKDQIALLRLSPDQHYDVYIFDFDSVVDIERNQRRPLRLIRGDVVYVPKKRIGNAVEFVDHYIRRMLPFNANVGAIYNLNDED